MVINPMNKPASLDLARQSPRCGAKTRQGTPCKCPAMQSRKRCRLHGGASPGAPSGAANGNYRHGRYTAEAKGLRAQICDLVRQAAETTSLI